MRINFAEVEQPKAPEPVKKGKYNVRCVGATEDEVQNGPNAGSPMYKLEFDIQAPGEDEDGRKVWDNMSLIAPSTDPSTGKKRNGTYWRAQQALQATGIAADDDLDLDDLDGEGTDFCEHMMDQELILDVEYVAARTDPKSGKDYNAQNRVKRFIADSGEGSNLP